MCSVKKRFLKIPQKTLPVMQPLFNKETPTQKFSYGGRVLIWMRPFGGIGGKKC